MIFGLDGKVRRSRLFSPLALCARGVLFVYLPESYLPCSGTCKR